MEGRVSDPEWAAEEDIKCLGVPSTLEHRRRAEGPGGKIF